MKSAIPLFVFFAISILSIAKNVESTVIGVSAESSAKGYIKSFFFGDAEALSNTHSAKVYLMPGHEFLKEEYELAKEKDYNTGLEVSKEKLLAVMEKSFPKRKKMPEDKVLEMLNSLSFKVIETTAGDFATDPSDPVGTPDGKLHFQIKEGDALVKVSPPKGDFLLLHFRKEAEKWLVVSEYID